MSDINPTSPRAVTDPEADPNLILKQQQTNATPTTDQSPIPAPPPLPGTGPMAGGATSAPSTASDTTPNVSATGATLTPSTPASPAPTDAPSGYGGTGKYGDLSYADAVQAKYRDQQAQAAATGVDATPQDYSMAGLQSSGDWGMSSADQAANAQRAASIANDPASSPSAKALVSMPGYGTAPFDQSLNNGSNPALASSVRALLAQGPSSTTGAPGTPGTPPAPPALPALPASPSSSLLPAGASASLTPTAPATMSTSGTSGAALTMSPQPISSTPPLGTQPIGASPAQPIPASGLTPGAPNDAGTPSSGLGTQMSSAAPIGGTAGGPYTPANVAIGSTVLPNADPRLQGTQSALDTASQSLAGVDRTKLAQDMFDQFQQSSDPAYKLALRRATQAGAGAGRIGSGQLRTSYGDLANQRNQQLDLAKRGFMSDALNGSIADQFNKVNALSGLEGQQFGEGAQNRNELRGERGYQGSLEDQAYQRSLQEYLLQQQAQQQQFNNGATLTGIGESGNPAGFYTQMASQLGVDPSVIMALAGSMGRSSVGNGTGPTGTSSTGGFQVPQMPSFPGFPGGTPPFIPNMSAPQFPNGQLPG